MILKRTELVFVLVCLSVLITPIGFCAASDDSIYLNNSGGSGSNGSGSKSSVMTNLKNVGGDKVGLKENLGEILGMTIQGVLALVGMIFLILMVYAGVLWMTAAGNEEKSEHAQKIITMAIVGLVIVMAAYAITVFVTINMGGSIS